jgi:O-antigen/teichoic acid export membrane protein
MTTPTVESPPRGFRAPGTTFMVSGGLIGSLGAYVFQVYGGRVLGTVAFAPVAALWTVFFILATILLVPVEQYVTREVASGRKALPYDLKPAMTMAAIGSVLGAGFVLMTLDLLFDGDIQYVAQIVLLLVGYAFLFVGKGVLAGSRRFAGVGWVMIVETVARLVAGVVAIQLVASATSLGWGMVLGGFAVLGLRWWRHDNGEPRVRHLPASGFLAGYAGGTASSQLLLGGAPIAVAALGGSDVLFSVIFVTFTLYRAPLTLIFALQGRILPYLVGLAGDSSWGKLSRIARSVVIAGFGLALLGGLVGWVVGPEVVALLFGEEFAPTAVVAMLAAAGVVAAATAQIASQVLVAEGKTTRLSFAWLGGLIVGVVVLIVGGAETGARVATGFAAGEFAALGLMALLSVYR